MLAHSYHPDHPPRPLSPPLTPPGTESDKSSEEPTPTTTTTTTTQSTTSMENPLYNQLHPDPTHTQLLVKDEFSGFNSNNLNHSNSPRLEQQQQLTLVNRMKQWKEDHLEPQGTTLELDNNPNGFTSSNHQPPTSTSTSHSHSTSDSDDLERYKSNEGQASSVNDFKPSKELQDDRERFKNKVHQIKQHGQDKLIELGLKQSSVSQAVKEDKALDPRVKGMLDRPLRVEERDQDSTTTTTDGEYLSGDETETEGEGGSGQSNGNGLLMPKLGRMLTQDSTNGGGGYSTSGGASFYSAESDFSSTVESLNLPSSSNGHEQEEPRLRARSESPVSFTVDGTSPPRLSPFNRPTPASSSSPNRDLDRDRSPVAFAPGYVHTNSRLVPTQTPSAPPISPTPPSPKPSTSPRLSIPLPYVSTPSPSPSSTSRLVPTASIVKPSTSHPSLNLVAQSQPHAVHQHSNLAPPPPLSFQSTHQPTRRASTTATSHPPPSNLSSSAAVRRGSSASTHLRPHPSSSSHQPHPSSSSSSSSSMMPARSLSASILPPSPSGGGISQAFLPPPPSQSSYTSLSYPPLSASLQSPSLSRSTNPSSQVPSIHDDVELSIAFQAEQIRRQRLEKRIAEAERVEGKGKGRANVDEDTGLGFIGGLTSNEGMGGGRRRTSRNSNSGSRSQDREGQGQGQGGGMVNSSSSSSTIQAFVAQGQNSSALSTTSLVPPPSLIGLGKSPSVRSSSLPQSQGGQGERSGSGGSSMMNAMREKEREKEHGLVLGSGGRTVSGESSHQFQELPTTTSTTGSPTQLQQTSPQLARMNSTAQSPQLYGGGNGNGNEKSGMVEEETPGVTNPLVGNLIGTDHENYVLMYNMLTGIRIGVSRCQAKAARPLTDADYTARHKFSFDIVGNELTPSVRYDFKFKDYAPWVFRELREYFFLDPSDYLISLTAKYILSELGSPGKSGSFFYFSRDYRFIIKTIRHSEHKFLRKILKEYHEHVMKNPHTLLSRFYGLHRVKLPHGRKIHFVIMNNLFPPHRDIHETYDLKGSSIGRMYPEQLASHNPHATLKDLNWIYRHRELALGPEKKALFEEQLRRDTELMQKLGIMDYSLLTGVHMAVKGNDERLREGKLSVFQPDAPKPTRKLTQVHRSADASALRAAVQRSDPQSITTGQDLPEHDTSTERRRFLFYQDEGGMRATGDGNEDLGVIYYLGIIDILTPYTLVKRLEHFFKGIKNDKHCISAVPPKEYGDRFLGFIRSCIRGNPQSLRPKMCMPSILEEGEEGEVEKGCCPPAMMNGGGGGGKEGKREEMREKVEGEKGKEKVQ